MNNERLVIGAAMGSKVAFNQLDKLKATKHLSEMGRHIYEGIERYYDRDTEAVRVDSHLLGSALNTGPTGSTVKALVESIATDQHSPENAVHYFAEMRKEEVGCKLAALLAAGKHGDDTAKLLDEYASISEDAVDDDNTAEILVGMDVTELALTQRPEGLIKIYPKSLNDRLDGGLLPGHHMVVFARPEMGKTLMLVNMMAGFLQQGKRVLYVGNEDPIQDIAMRLLTRLTGMNKFEIIDNPEKADALARERGYENIVLAALAPGTPREIEALITEYKPAILLIDQLRNINVKEDHFVMKLERAATVARNLGKRHKLVVISVTQAGDSASGKAVLDMGDVDSSNTGIPAQADVMVGIGGTEDDVERGWRVLSLPKNKRSGKHEYFTIGVEPIHSRIRSIE